MDRIGDWMDSLAESFAPEGGRSTSLASRALGYLLRHRIVALAIFVAWCLIQNIVILKTPFSLGFIFSLVLSIVVVGVIVLVGLVILTLLETLAKNLAALLLDPDHTYDAEVWEKGFVENEIDRLFQSNR